MPSATSNECLAALTLTQARNFADQGCINLALIRATQAYVIAYRSHTGNGSARRGDGSRFDRIFADVGNVDLYGPLIESLQGARQEHAMTGTARDAEEGQPLTDLERSYIIDVIAPAIRESVPA